MTYAPGDCVYRLSETNQAPQPTYRVRAHLTETNRYVLQSNRMITYFPIVTPEEIEHVSDVHVGDVLIFLEGPLVGSLKEWPQPTPGTHVTVQEVPAYGYSLVISWPGGWGLAQEKQLKKVDTTPQTL